MVIDYEEKQNQGPISNQYILLHIDFGSNRLGSESLTTSTVLLCHVRCRQKIVLLDIADVLVSDAASQEIRTHVASHGYSSLRESVMHFALGS